MHKTKGFTLIELLVVIAIIAILLAILMPALQRVKTQASAVVCKSNLHQWGVIWHMYTQENEGKFPVAILTWRDLVEDYHKDKDQKITLCPRAKKLYTDGARAPFAPGRKPGMVAMHPTGVDLLPVVMGLISIYTMQPA